MSVIDVMVIIFLNLFLIYFFADFETLFFATLNKTKINLDIVNRVSTCILLSIAVLANYNLEFINKKWTLIKEKFNTIIKR